MGRAPCCDKANVKRGPWSPEEDATLRSYLEAHGTAGNWIALPKKAGLRRCGKSCRLRWLNYLRPDIKHGGFTEEEDSVIISLYTEIGSRWSVIASQLPGRTDNDVKNYWNTKLKKRLLSGKISLPSPNSILGATNNSFSTSSVGINNEFIPSDQNYGYQGFPVVSEAGTIDPSMFTASFSHVHYAPSLKTHSPSPEIGAGSMVDFRGNINSSMSQECSSANSSGNSLGAMDNNRAMSVSVINSGGMGEYSGANSGFGFGFSWDVLINELLFDEKIGEISPNYALAEVSPQVLNQSSFNFQY